MTDTVVIARLTGAGVARVYEQGKVPPRPDYPYAVAGVDTGMPRARGLAGGAGTSLVRAYVQAFGRTTLSVRTLLAAADGVLNDVHLTEIPGAPRSERELAAQILRDPDDDGVLYELHTYTWEASHQ